MKTGIMIDLHGTLLNSNLAWIEALKEIDSQKGDFYEKEVWKKRSRKQLAAIAGVTFEELTERYRSKLKIRLEVVNFVRALSGNYPLVIVSNAEKGRVEEDMRVLEGLSIQKVFSKENGTKPNLAYLESILTEMNWDNAFLIGNDIEEDYIVSDKIISVIIPYQRIREVN